MKRSGLCAVAALVGLAACSGGAGTLPLPGGSGAAQPAGNAGAPAASRVILHTKVGKADRLAAKTVRGFSYHAFARGGARKRPAVWYPLDMQYHGGARMRSATQHGVYLNEPSGKMWGNPMTFMQNLNADATAPGSFVNAVLDQYVKVTTPSRYPAGNDIEVSDTMLYRDSYGALMMSEGDVLAQLHAAVVALGLSNPGYAHEFHIFLPKGVDQCFDFGGGCFSPDVPSEFAFCAWHGSADFNDIGHVIFSLEPYQGIVQRGLPSCYGSHTAIANATANTLSHEFFESASDPDVSSPGLRSAWYNDFTGMEIGDACVAKNFTQNFAGTAYTIQEEYSNADHGCIP